MEYSLDYLLSVLTEIEISSSFSKLETSQGVRLLIQEIFSMLQNLTKISIVMSLYFLTASKFSECDRIW